MTSSRTSQTSGAIESTYFFAALMFWTDFRSTSRLMMNGLKSSSQLGQAALVQLERRARDDHGRPE